jgi:hypothetical protein
MIYLEKFFVILYICLISYYYFMGSIEFQSKQNEL